MTRLFTRARALPSGRPRTRSAAVIRRLHAARRSFDLSVLALRKAALDHVDLQDLASLALQANLTRLVERLGADA
ncbi:hypothetical protein [Methylobacterium gnaphalii]|uniref:Uncharacterized protein n=1 Tax=Methylobacterium gnaphalii TaxID=1010610 RepID=A0A512JI00_9HYPH|nr:hypothetical protein [Methylobacterium gnaphalii]GEP09589.1 hypothetical protein MGN01_14340 [Methylobacterium gnaphalii]GJD67824.1 hypothetical protein MMMDOFMJ_0741 [Methylobacterium gnaphalii]GLS48113.1 hypothetical protein GCM10007885_09570 [Methylobacterium gnaphalii]